MRHTATLFVLALLATTAVAQSPARAWKRGSLALKDFAAAPLRGSDRNSYMHYGIRYNTNGVSDGLNTYIFCKTSAVMFPADSWLAEGHADERELNYNQAVFDLVEIHSRQMQREAQMLTKIREYDFLLAATLDRLERELRAFDAATAHGSDSLALERMRQQNRRWLAENPGSRPEFTPRPLWWMIDMGLGAYVNAIDMGKHIGPSIGTIDYTLAVGFKRLGVSLHLTQASCKLMSNPDEDNWPAGQVWEREELHARLGFSVIDKPTHSLTPFVGVGMTNFYKTDYSLPGSMDSDALLTFTLGATGMRHIHHWHYIRNGLKQKAKRVTASVSASLFGSYSSDPYYANHKMFTLGLRMGLSMRTQREKVTWPQTNNNHN